MYGHGSTHVYLFGCQHICVAWISLQYVSVKDALINSFIDLLIGSWKIKNSKYFFHITVLEIHPPPLVSLHGLSVT